MSFTDFLLDQADYPAISYSSLNGDGRDSLYRLIEQKVCE